MSSRRWRGCRRPDRAWLAAMNAALLVPIFAGGSDPRPFVGLIALGDEAIGRTRTRRRIASCCAASRCRWAWRSTCRGCASKSSSTTRAPDAEAGDASLHADRGGRRRRRRQAIAVGAVVDGKYRVDAVIGQGGMGAVFRAWDVRLERAVAIKVVRADLIADPDSRDALPARVADRRAAAASVDRDGLRLRQPRRRRGVPGDGVRARRGPAPLAEARGPSRSGADVGAA